MGSDIKNSLFSLHKTFFVVRLPNQLMYLYLNTLLMKC